MLSFITAVIAIVHRCIKNRITLYAAQSSFFMVLSAIPLMFLLTIAVRYLSPLSQGTLTAALIELVPGSLAPFVVSVIDELYSHISTTIISFSVITVLWSASKGIYALEMGLNQIYRVTENRPFLLRRLLAALYTAAFVGIVLFCLILVVFGNRLQILLSHLFPLLGEIMNMILRLRALLAAGVLTLFFSLLYHVLPNRKLRYQKQLPGAVFAALGWMLFSFFYSIYVNRFSHYDLIYGSMTSMVLLCLWIYVCMQIVLIGAEINMWLSERK